jgi:hypothetical protein
MVPRHGAEHHQGKGATRVRVLVGPSTRLEVDRAPYVES